MAYLDQKLHALKTQVALVEKEYNIRLRDMQAQHNNTILSLRAEIGSVTRAITEHKGDIEAKYNIALRSYTYNDETGVLTKQIILDMENARKDGAAHSNTPEKH
jgi:hypothetical protein